MALIEQIKEIIEILPEGHVQIKKVTEIYKDGVLIANNIHREAIEPGADVSAKSARVKDVAAAVWKPEVIAAKQAEKEAAAAKEGKGKSV